MKKLISVLMIVAMIASIAAVSTSAGILYTDTFDGDELNGDNWIVEGNLFYVEEGWCKGWHDAVVNQSNFLEELGGTKRFGLTSFSVDVAFFDFDNDNGTGGASLWWRDYRWDAELEEDYAVTSYMFSIDVVEKRVDLTIGGFEEYYPDFMAEDEDRVVATYTLPEDFELKVDPSNPTIVNLGMRIKQEVVECYVNGEKVISFDVPAELPIVAEVGSPLLLWNHGMYVGFDNFVAATNDYPLFAADLTPDPEPNPPADDNNDVTPPADDNNDVTPPADNGGATPPAGNGGATPPAGNNQQNNNQQNNNQQTNQGGNSNVQNGAQTGDAAIVVLAVMIVALGTAVAVKKISVR